MFNFFKKKETQIDMEEKIVLKEDFKDVTPVAAYFKNETGVTFDAQTSILKNKLMTFCRQREIKSFTKLLQVIKSDKNIKQELTDALTTNETFFYREFKQIEQLVELVKASHSSVRILCAPSATGEEPYSIAIALLQAGVSSSNFSIIGIDINSDALSKANKAVYKERNVRNLSQSIIMKYFSQEDDKYILGNEIKSLVSFKQFNLFDDALTHLGKFDFIFSRNMLIYFDKETKIKAKTILENLRNNDDHKIFFGHADLF